jgi:hypothetical protein
VSSALNVSTVEIKRDLTNIVDSWWILPFIILTTIVLIIGVVDNTIVIIVVSKRKGLHTPTFTAIACLSVADLRSLCTRYMKIIDRLKCFMGYQIWVMYPTVTFYFLLSANFHVVLIAYLRYVFIINPLQSLKITTKSVLQMSGRVWLAGVFI